MARVLSASLHNVLKRIQFVHRNEAELVQLLNEHRLHLQVLCSAPWSKTLYDGLGAAAVRPNFDLERSCRLVFQQMFYVQSVNTASDSADDSDNVACVTDQ